MKNPNGYGSVVNLGKHRRNPWAVRVTAGWEEGKQIRRYISYHPTKKEALQALAQEQISPTSPKAKLTFDELYDEWSANAFRHLSKQACDCHHAAYLHLTPIHNMKFDSIRAAHMQKVIDELDRSKSTKTKIKSLCYQLFQYAMENDIVSKNYAQFIRLDKETKTEKDIFTDTDIQKLFDNDALPYADTVIILIYTGLRIQEFLDLKKDDIDFNKNIIVGGLKTDAGRNRAVPIHSKILKYIKARYEQSEVYLIEREGNPVSANYYRKYIYYDLLDKLEIPRHSPHSTRHTCATLLARSGADPLAIKQVLGHTDYAFTANVYTHTDTEFLNQNMAKI